MTPDAGRRRSSTAPIGVLIGLAAVPALLIAGTWQLAAANVPAETTTTTTTVPPPPGPPMETDLLSYRRHPTPLAVAAADTERVAQSAALADGLLKLIDPASCADVRAGDELLAQTGAATPVIPASNEKLFVAAVALAKLGADYTFRTELRSQPPVAGVIPGNVYLVGGGDPLLRTADVADPLTHPSFNTTALEPLADQLAAIGLTTIEGDVVGDGSRYDDEFDLRGIEWDESITNSDAGPYDALLVNDGLLDGAYGLEPNRAAARVFLDLLTARGITVTGAAANSATPADPALTTLALIESLPLSEVLVEMLHTSDNNTAEMLLKEIGFVGAGAGSRAAGLDVVRATLQEWGVALDGIDLRDGSGLSRNNRVTCPALLALVSTAPVADQLQKLLPVAGRDGTLDDQLLDTPAEGRLQAKTGTLTDVKALTGELPDGTGRAVDFSVVLNEPSADESGVYQPVWDALIKLIDDTPVVVEPDVARFAPLMRN